MRLPRTAPGPAPDGTGKRVVERPAGVPPGGNVTAPGAGGPGQSAAGGPT